MDVLSCAFFNGPWFQLQNLPQLPPGYISRSPIIISLENDSSL